MEQHTDSHLTPNDTWLHVAWKEVIRSIDFGAALVAFFPALAITLDNPSIRAAGTGILVAVGALSMALTALVGGILAILATWLDETYRRVLQMAKGGWRGAMRPYKVTATLGVITVLVATFSYFLWSIANTQLQSVLLALTLSLFVWTAVGSIQVFWITFFHGEMKAELLKGMDEARKALRKRRDERRVG
jgi:MFS family permease